MATIHTVIQVKDGVRLSLELPVAGHTHSSTEEFCNALGTTLDSTEIVSVTVNNYSVSYLEREDVTFLTLNKLARTIERFSDEQVMAMHVLVKERWLSLEDATDKVANDCGYITYLDNDPEHVVYLKLPNDSMIRYKFK